MVLSTWLMNVTARALVSLLNRPIGGPANDMAKPSLTGGGPSCVDSCS